MKNLATDQNEKKVKTKFVDKADFNSSFFKQTLVLKRLSCRALRGSLKICNWTDSVHAVLPWQRTRPANQITHESALIWFHLPRGKLSPANWLVSVKQ